MRIMHPDHLHRHKHGRTIEDKNGMFGRVVFDFGICAISYNGHGANERKKDLGIFVYSGFRICVVKTDTR